MPTSNPLVREPSLRETLITSEGRIVSEETTVAWRELAESRWLSACYRRCVMIRTSSQRAAAMALIELQGVAQRIVLCPAELPDKQCLAVARAAQVEVVVLDEPWQGDDRQADDLSAAPEFERVLLPNELPPSANVQAGLLPDERDGSAERPAIATEWVLLTSGTTGAPKLVVHSFASLTCGVQGTGKSTPPPVWGTFYDIRRYGGLQIFLRAALAGATLVLSSKQETVAQHLARAGRWGVTHISGTPSHWRRALMSQCAGEISPCYVRLSGEIADQAILDQLRLQYPQATIVHAFASTEAGVVFEVSDGRAGVPQALLEPRLEARLEARLGRHSEIETKLEAQTLRVRSPRTADRYLGPGSPALKDDDGFVNTRDVLTLANRRYFFGGRQDGTINVGGLKVHPEEVEAVLNSHPRVSLSLVRGKPSPVLGGLVIADVLLSGASSDTSEAKRISGEVMAFCRERLPAYKVPALIRPVSSLQITDTGKLARPLA